ncbi:hypothetical protein MRX96_000581 [Rhipicephalus microplus]
MPWTPKGPYDLETSYQGGYKLTSPVEEAGTPELQAKPHRSARKENRVVRFAPSLVFIDEATSLTQGSTSRSSEPSVTSHKQSKHASARQPRNDSVCVLVEEVPEPPTAKFLGRLLDAWGSMSAAFFVVLGLLVFCLGAVEAANPDSSKGGGLFLLVGGCSARDVGGDVQRGQRPHPIGGSRDHNV